eukprot:SAG31_NODE_6470_length_2005_cov_1.936516_1_plen_89_part_00
MCFVDAGEIVTRSEAEADMRRGSEYLFDLGGGCVVDAHRMGNATRRINHAKAAVANVEAKIVNHFGVRKACLTRTFQALSTACNVGGH